MEEFIEVEPVKTLAQKLMAIQEGLKVEKGRYNEFGGYYSRSKEDILEAVKPLAHANGCVVLCDDEMLLLDNGWVYVKATASLVDAITGAKISATAQAREQESRPKMDASQLTGSAASYAGKRALGNLFAIDDTADADQAKPAEKPNDKIGAKCTACGAPYLLTREQFETFLCPQCGNRRAKAQ